MYRRTDIGWGNGYEEKSHANVESGTISEYLLAVCGKAAERRRKPKLINYIKNGIDHREGTLMADIRPFRAVRPEKSIVGDVAALPYDVYSREEAAEAVKGRPLSFLNIDRPETMFPPDQDMYADEVYAAAGDRYQRQKAEGIYLQDEKPCFYIYEETMDGRVQTGIAALSSVDDYLNGICKKHENTVAKKEQDRIRHVDALSAQTGPIFLSYHARPAIDEAVNSWKEAHEAENDFQGENGVRHRVWAVTDDTVISLLQKEFAALDSTYIADGHHRAASAVKVALMRREAAGTGYDRNAEYNYFLSVLFPDEQLKIMDYNRVVKDLNGFTVPAFLEALEENFEIGLTSLLCREESSGILAPSRKYEIGMYLGGRSYLLRAKPELIGKIAEDPVKSLDVSVLQEEVLSKLLGIEDPRTDSRIRFIGGIRGTGELVREAETFTKAGAESGKADRGPAAAFAMYPTSITELFRVADAGLLMPPKSTWFEPKLRSGLVTYKY